MFRIFAKKFFFSLVLVKGKTLRNHVKIDEKLLDN